jgi:nucleotide-binding universal stress UspA family protein
MFKTIITATDGSDHATRAVKIAAGLARLSKAKLVLVHVRPHYGTISMLQQAIAAKKRLPADVNNEIRRLKGMERMAAEAGAAGAAFPIHGMLSQPSLDAIALLTLQDAEKVAKAARLSAVSHVLLNGDPAENILSVAKKKKADVIVLGRRGMGRLSGLIIGSVSQKVNQLADCPVFTVK